MAGITNRRYSMLRVTRVTRVRRRRVRRVRRVTTVHNEITVLITIIFIV